MRKTLIAVMAMLAFAPQSFANLKPGSVTVVKGAWEPTVYSLPPVEGKP